LTWLVLMDEIATRTLSAWLNELRGAMSAMRFEKRGESR
jgi:hypothetical protein